MFFRNLNLIMLFVWLVVGVVILFREVFLPGKFENEADPTRLNMFGYASLFLAGWNLVRFLMTRSLRQSREHAAEVDARLSVKRQYLGGDPPVTDPQFQFDLEKDAKKDEK